MSIRCSIVFYYLLFLMVHLSRAQRPEPPPDLPEIKMSCKPFGACEPCPEDSLREPFCQPFGNRRLMHCIPKSRHNTNSTIQNPVSQSPPPPHLLSPPQGETPAWQSCGKIPVNERSDFFEFILCNVLFTSVALGMLFLRSRRLEAMQARQLAARIGFVRGPGGVLVRG